MMFDILEHIEDRIADPITFYFVLGFDFEEKGKYKDAVESWKKVLKYLRIDSEIRIIIYTKISNIYKIKGQYEEAIAWLEKAKKIKNKSGHEEEINQMLKFLQKQGVKNDKR